MKKMIIRLLVAKMIPVALGFVKKTFRKKKTADQNIDVADIHQPKLDAADEA